MPPRSWRCRGRDHRRDSSGGIWQGSASHGCSRRSGTSRLPRSSRADRRAGVRGGADARASAPRALVGACLVKALFALPTWTRVAALIAEHPGLQAALGGAPSVWACYRFTVKLRENQPALADCLDRVTAALTPSCPATAKDIAIDASDMPAFANGQRYVYNGGPERERYSDPDASWGHRSRRLHARSAAASTATRSTRPSAPAPACRSRGAIETARRNESLFVAPLLDAVRARGFQPETCAMDKGYDNNRVLDETRERGCMPIVCSARAAADPAQPRSPTAPTSGSDSTVDAPPSSASSAA